ncbi:hypothetical protein AVEN_156318-1 [Araneus ventricosus]|uniref:Uncharacterized protein n=1 Tax=Araneus ventricosus TaxID=182803 RepID=A0A4Y2L4K9_ARAVE|nr:hypothetical protein AVEN_156318-1 [Araneus ventricosus]
MSNHTLFQEDWLSDPSFSSWIEKMPLNNKIAKCKLCNKTFDLSNMGRRAVSSHMDGSKHKKKVKASQISASLFRCFTKSEQYSIINCAYIEQKNTSDNELTVASCSTSVSSSSSSTDSGKKPVE